MKVPEPKKRFEAVSDLPEWTVYDHVEQRDLFPTKSGNRQYACQTCDEHIALLIAEALNAYIANAPADHFSRLGNMVQPDVGTLEDKCT